MQEYAKRLYANSERIPPLLLRIQNQVKPLHFGATLTIGEYTLPPILCKMIEENPDTNISMFVENT